MKKGFTLIELLAVIIILAVILVIAVPQVMKVVDNSRINAYIKNEQIVLKAVDLYVSRNTGSLPGEIGSTTEVSISYLVSNGMLTEITNPYNKSEDCTGYVTIMKLSDTEYDYTPHLKCGLDIHSSSDDGLVLHYKFDDFQEPTEKLLPPFTDPLWNINSHVNVIGDWELEMVTSSNWRTNRVDIEMGAGETLTFSAYMYGDSRMDLYMAAFDQNNNSLGSVRNRSYEQGRRSITFTTPEGTAYVCAIIRNDSQTGANDYYNFKNPQLERKKYATPFIYGERQGFVKDHSGNENHAELNLSTTPRYIENARNNSGAYKFDGVNKTISINNDGINFAEPFSFSIWFKNLEEDSNLNRVRLINKKSSWNISDGYAIQLNLNGEIRVLGSDSIEVNSRVLNQWDNEWHHLVVVFNNNNVLVFLDGEQKNSYVTINTPKNNTSILYLGGSLNRYFNGGRW